MKEKLEKPMDNLQERIEEVLKCWDINVHNEAVGHVNVSQLIRDMQARMVEQDTSKDKLVAALNMCMIGGNHLAHILIKNLGASFCDEYPFDANYGEILEKLGVGDNYDVWCCWSQIMKAREAQEDDRA